MIEYHINQKTEVGLVVLACAHDSSAALAWLAAVNTNRKSRRWQRKRQGGLESRQEEDAKIHG